MDNQLYHPFSIIYNNNTYNENNIIDNDIDIKNINNENKIITTNNDNNECIITINALNIDDEECVICTYELHLYDIITTSCCKQKIHKKCIVECFRNSGSCPLCRAKYILKQNLEVTYENYEMKSEVEKKNTEVSQQSSSNPLIISNTSIQDEECISYNYDISITCMCKYIVPMIFCCFIIAMLVMVGVIPLFHYSNHDYRNCLDNYSNCTYNKNTTNTTYNKNTTYNNTHLKNLTKY